MTYQNALKKIHSFPRTALEPTLERMKLLCKYLGDPQKKLKFVHIAGTNGKGSLTAMLDSILRKGGYTVGRYISPFILDFRERMTVGGEMISFDELCVHTKAVIDAVHKMELDIAAARQGGNVPYPIPKILLDGRASESPVQFEVVTAIAFLYFLSHRCDAVLLECGLGGKYDATNVIDPPMAAVIMNIGLDHTELLGDTVEKIAEEKCGIIKKGTSEVITYPQTPSVMAVISKHTVAAGARLSVPFKNEISVKQATPGGLHFTYRKRTYMTKLAAAYQTVNAAVAVETASALDRLGMKLSHDTVALGLEETRFPARFEVLGVSPAVIVDGAHNDCGVLALCDSIRALTPKIEGGYTFAVGMLRDKDPKTALAPFAELVNSGEISTVKVVTLTPDSPRAMGAEELAVLLREMLRGDVEIEAVSEIGKKLCGAVERALSHIGRQDAVVSFGSLYLAAEMRSVLAEFLEEHEL